jgi:hypothetical protein
MKFKYLLSFLFVILFQLTTQAQTVSGKILSSTDEEIPFATIQIGSDYGVISNEEGDFSIDTEGFSATEIVVISCLGFENLTMDVKSFISNNYILKERMEELSEVFISNKKLTVEEILQNVQANIASNYNTNNESEIFFRTTAFITSKKVEFKILKATELPKNKIKAINSEFETLRKGSENKTSSNYNDLLLNYSKFNDTSKIKILKATKLINESEDKSADKLQKDLEALIMKQLDTNATYKVKSGIFKVDDSLKVINNTNTKSRDSIKTQYIKQSLSNILKKNTIENENSYFSFIFNLNKNDYKIEAITYLNENSIYKISFTPKRKSEIFQGIIYVNTDDFAIVKIDYELGEGKLGYNLNVKALLGFKMSENKINGSVFYKKDESGFYNIQYIKSEKETYMYMSRPFKFIKNKENEDDDKNVLKFDFKTENIITTKKEIYFTKNSLNTETTFSQFENSETYFIEKIKAYNPEIWKNHNVIAPVKAIENYHLE